MSAGRSGSTILDIVLSNHPGLEGVGELINLPEKGWLKAEYCSCGRRVPDCSFWRRVGQNWGGNGKVGVKRYLELQRSFMRYRHCPRLWRQRSGPSDEFREYSRRTGELYRAIREAGSSRMIVDSSKNPVRALALSMMPEIDFYLLHLVRDCRGVAWSEKKSFNKDEQAGLESDMPGRPAWQTARAWTAVNLFCGWVKRRLPAERTMRLRYEDLVAKPRESLSRIADWIGLDFGQLMPGIDAGQELHKGHTVAGNRLRMQKRLRLKADIEWQRKLPSRDRLIIWAGAGWLMKAYGYTK